MTNQITWRPNFWQYKKVPEAVTYHPQKISYHNFWSQTDQSFWDWRTRQYGKYQRRRQWELQGKTERYFKYRHRKEQTKVLENKEPLETDKTENVGDNTKEDDSENSEKKLKDISNTEKETYE